MAKAEVSTIGIGALSAAHKRTLQGLKRQVSNIAQSLGVVREKVSEIAPRVIKFFTTLQAEIDGFTFVDFARLFDHTVPTHAADRDGVQGYRNHRMYYALDYMRRTVRQQAQGTKRRTSGATRDNATDALSRSIATLLQLIKADDAEKVFTAVQSEFSLSERAMTRLRKRVEATQPLFKVPASVKPVAVGNVIHMQPAATVAATPEPMAQPGRRIKVPA